MVVFDATFLLLLLQPNADPPIDPTTGLTVDAARERIDYLVENLQNAKTRIVIPTPALSETLIHAGEAADGYLKILKGQAVFRIVSFDERAAIEVAAQTATAIAAGNKRGDAVGSWAKIKYDRQIVAIAKVENVTTIYSDDQNVRKFGQSSGLTVIGIHELPLPPSSAQGRLALDAPEKTP